MQTATQNSELLQDQESERALLEGLTFDPDQLVNIAIRPTDFTNKNYRLFFEALMGCFADGVKPEYSTVLDYAPGLDRTLVLEIFSAAFTGANVAYHAQRIKAMSHKRFYRLKLIELSGKVTDPDFLKSYESAGIEFQDTHRDDYRASIKQVLVEIYDKAAIAKQQQHYGIQTGFERLNKAIIGACPGHLIVMGGYTSHGKSTILSQMVSDFCGLSEAKVVVFSVEDSRRDKLTRLLATETGLMIRDIVRGFASETALIEGMNRINSYNLEIYDDLYRLDEIELAIKKHKMRNGINIACIDFVQNIQTEGDSIFDRMSTVAIRLQQIAKRYEICIIALSQISADQAGKISLRGAQELASAADMVLWIERPDGAVEQAIREFTLIIRKNRPFGATGRIDMTFSENFTNVREL